MIKTIIKVLLVGTVIASLLLSIPDLLLPISDAIDDTFDTDTMLLLSNFYDAVSADIMTLFTMQFATIAIRIFISWATGSRGSSSASIQSPKKVFSQPPGGKNNGK